MKLGTYKFFRILSKISLLVIGVSLVGYLGYLTYQSVTFSPRKVRITNITENSATISWVTDTPTKGVVYYKQEDSFLPGPLGFVGAKKAYDDRDYYGAQLERVNDVNEKNLKNKDAEYVVDPENIDYEDFKVTKLGDYYTHHVTIRGLDPVSKYYFVVSDNWFSWDIDGVDQSRELTEVYGAVEFNFTTFDRLNSVPSPNPAYGKVVGVYRDENGFVHDNLNQDTVVYGFLFDEESLDQTSMYSSVTNEEGGWVIDKASMRSEDGSLPYNFKSGEDSIVLYPQYMNLEESFSVVLILGEEDSPASDLVGGQEVEITESNEISVLNNMLGLISTKVSAIALIDGVIGIAGSSSSLEAGRGRVVFVPTVAGSSGMSTDELQDIQTAIRELNKTGADPVDVVTNVYEYAEAGEDQGKKDEIIQRVTKKVLENNDDRYKQVPCTGTKSDWGINCYEGNTKLPVCDSNAVAAGCGTNAACYKSGQGEYGYANKCVGCTRPASCANVWARPSDVVVDGQLYTKNDILKVALGDIDNDFLRGLSDSLDGKTLCTNVAGDKWEIVKNASFCPKYWDDVEGGLDFTNLKSNTEKCKEVFGVLTSGSEFDVDAYCNSTIIKEGGANPKLLSNAVSQDPDNPYNCAKLRCKKGYEVIYRNNSNSECFCGSTESVDKWIRYDGEVVCGDNEIKMRYWGVDFCAPTTVGPGLIEEGNTSEDFQERKAYDFDVKSFPFNYYVNALSDYIERIGGIYEGKRGGSYRFWLTEEEYETLSKNCFETPNSSCGIKGGSMINHNAADVGIRYYEADSGVQLTVLKNNIGESFIISNYDELELIALRENTTVERIILNAQSYLSRGILKISNSDNGGLSVLSPNIDLYEKYQSVASAISYKYAANVYSEDPYSTVLPDKAAKYETDLYQICPATANDSIHCTLIRGEEESITGLLGITDDIEDNFTIDKVPDSSLPITHCPQGNMCNATYAADITLPSGQKTKILLSGMPYTSNGDFVPVELSNGAKIKFYPQLNSVSTTAPSNNFPSLEGNTYIVGDDKDLVEEAFENIINILWGPLGIFSPTKVQAQQLDKYVDGSNDKGLYEIITSSGKTVHYVDTTSSPYIVFYEEGNNEPGFQEPLDINNPQDGEDILVFVNKDSVKKISQAYQYWIEEGINMMSFPFLPVNQEKRAMMASDLMISNNTVVGKISQITYFENGKWQGGIKASGDNKYVGYDFPLVPGRGYLIVGEYGTNISIPGFPLSEPFPVELSAGWNFVGVHGYSDIYTAEKLIDELDKLEGIDVDNVTWWPRNLGRYEGLQKTGSTKYGFDYPLSDRLAYFVRVSSYSNKCPRSVLWNPGGEAHGICGSN